MTPQVTDRGISVGHLPPPCEFGAPDQFAGWRPEQEEALVLASESDQRFSILQMPTGAGKTLFGLMFGQMMGLRTVILTETKGLEDQYWQDGHEMGLVDIRGANNYPCPALETGGKYQHLVRGKATCDVGPCRTGMHCKLREDGCPYYDKLREARDAQMVVTNYANWLSIGKSLKDGREDPLGDFDLLVMDEVHAADSQVSKALTIEIRGKQLAEFFGTHVAEPPAHDELSRWEPWLRQLRKLQVQGMDGATQQLRTARDTGSVTKGLLEDIRYLRRLGNDLSMLESALSDHNEWVVDITAIRGQRTYSFQPIWPAPYCEQYLFRGVERVIGMSATVTEDAMRYIGLKPGKFDFWEFHSSFPVENRPIYFLPTAFMRYDMSEKEYRKWVTALDVILKLHPHDKGIIHTVSYARAQRYMRESEWQDRLIENTSKTTAMMVERFKNSDDPTVAVSPSIATGYDFPDDHCRFQVIGKVPFPDRRGKLIQKRMESDKDYSNYLAMNYIVQAAGRSTRSEDDWSYVYIIDGVFGRWYEKYKKYAPLWFRDAVKYVTSLKKPKRSSRKEKR